MLGLAACNEESSKDIGNAPLYQRYRVEFQADADDDVMAYANFSKGRDEFGKSVKLEGAQSVKVNGRSMDYRDLEEMHSFNYAYSTEVGEGIDDVTFTFTRNKGEVYTNMVRKDDVAEIRLPRPLAAVANGVPLEWTGVSGMEDGEVTAVLSRRVNGAFSSYNAEKVDYENRTITFANVPAGRGYTLLLTRTKKLDTRENNLPAGGKLEICFVDEEDDIEVR